MNAFDEADPVDPQTDPDGSSVQQRLVTLQKHLFRLMAEDKGLDTEEMAKCRIRDYIIWCNEHKDQWCEGQIKYETAAGLKLHITDVEGLEEIFSDPYDAVGLCMANWYMLSLSGRTPPEHVPSFTHLAVTMGFNAGDGGKEKAFQISIPCKFQPGAAMTDGFIASLLLDQMRSAAQTIATMGIDVIYEKYAQDVSDKQGKVLRQSVDPADRNPEIRDGL